MTASQTAHHQSAKGLRTILGGVTNQGRDARPGHPWAGGPLPATSHPGLPPATLSDASPYTRYSILDTLVCHFCTFARGTAAFALLYGISAALALESSGPPALDCVPCPHAPALTRCIPCQPVNLSTCQPVCIAPAHRPTVPPVNFTSQISLTILALMASYSESEIRPSASICLAWARRLETGLPAEAAAGVEPIWTPPDLARISSI